MGSFLKHRKVPLPKVSVLWDKSKWMVNYDTPPLLCTSFSDTRNFRNTKGFPFEVFWSTEKKVSIKSRYLFLRKQFALRHLSETSKASNKNRFATVRQKKSQRQIVIHLILSTKVSETETKSETLEDSSLKSLGLCDRCFLRNNRDIPSYPWTFSIPEAFWNTVGFIYGPFRYCETSSWYAKRSFGTRKLLNTEWILCYSIWYWEKNF